MKKQLLTLLFISLSFFSFCQNKIENKKAVGISLPFIWNNSYGIYYSLGNRKEPSGKAISYGININYYRKVYKNWFVSGGAGYFKQSFNIIRPFDFNGDTITKLQYYTKNYHYHCIPLNAGVGYSQPLNDKLKINGLATYNLLNSFIQTYTPTRFSGLHHKTKQVNSKKLLIGSMVNLSAGIEYLLSKRISIGSDVLIPLITTWKDDEIFRNSSLWANDTQKIAETTSSMGAAISCKYHF